jgi:hypothetical protein
MACCEKENLKKTTEYQKIPSKNTKKKGCGSDCCGVSFFFCPTLTETNFPIFTFSVSSKASSPIPYLSSLPPLVYLTILQPPKI